MMSLLPTAYVLMRYPVDSELGTYLGTFWHVSELRDCLHAQPDFSKYAFLDSRLLGNSPLMIECPHVRFAIYIEEYKRKQLKIEMG